MSPTRPVPQHRAYYRNLRYFFVIAVLLFIMLNTYVIFEECAFWDLTSCQTLLALKSLLIRSKQLVLFPEGFIRARET